MTAFCRWTRQVPVEIDVDCARDVAFQVCLTTLVRIEQSPSNVTNHDLVEDVLKFFDTDERIHTPISADTSAVV